MGEQGLSKVAASLGVSRSAVSKALNHCPGIGDTLREQILAAADAEGLTGRQTVADAHIILPETPGYFWGALREALETSLVAHGIRIKTSVYTTLGTASTVERYLREAEETDAPLVLVAAKYDGLAERLSDIARRRAVFSVCEDVAPRGVFYFGSDRHADGALLASRCAAENPRRVLLLGQDDGRQAGFLSATDAEVQRLPLTEGINASLLAREMDALHKAFPFDIAVTLDGITSICCMALKKCRLSVPCYGFEMQLPQPRYGVPRGVVCQDCRGIASVAAQAAARYLRERVYPDKKYTYVASSYRTPAAEE